jgi:1,4-dihydroxy-2-naphthoyl-CoA hydrolase
MLWFNKNLQLSDLAEINKNTMGAYIGLEFTELGNDFIKAKIPIDYRTRQPYGILHGGASCVLAETLGSVASAMVIDHTKYISLGIEINANHVRSISSGVAEGVCKPLHLGKTIHVWEINIYDDKRKLTCVSRITVMIKKR